MSNSANPVGVIRVDANYQGIKAVCDRAGIQAGGALFIWDDAGNQMYSNNQTEQAELAAALNAAHPFESDVEDFHFVWQIRNTWFILSGFVQRTGALLIYIPCMY